MRIPAACLWWVRDYGETGRAHVPMRRRMGDAIGYGTEDWGLMGRAEAG